MHHQYSVRSTNTLVSSIQWSLVACAGKRPCWGGGLSRDEGHTHSELQRSRRSRHTHRGMSGFEQGCRAHAFMDVGLLHAGRSQQAQLIRIDRVENFYAAPSRSRSRSRGRSSGTGGTMAPMRATAGAPLPRAPLVLPKARSKARPFSVFVPWCAELTRASLRRAMRASGAPGEPPARQATEATLGSWVAQR